MVIEPIGPAPLNRQDVPNAQANQVDETGAGGQPSEWVYFSAPIAVQPDGTWQAEVFIPAEDEREVNVYMAECSWRSLAGVAGGGIPGQVVGDPTLVINRVISSKVHSSLRAK